MKRWVLWAVCVLCAAGGFAKDNLAILPFTGGQGEEGETIAELFSFEPELTAVFNPVPRTSINRAIRSEQRFQYESGMTDPDTAVALGKQLGARYVVSGSITALGKQKLLIIGILQIDDLRQIAGDIQTYTNIEEIAGKLPGMAKRIAAAARVDASKLPRLALPPVALSGGADPQTADALARILAIHIIRGGKYAVYPRTASLEQIQEEYANQFSGDTADENLPDLGKGTNPNLALSVTARKLGSQNMFNAAIINLVTGVQETGEAMRYQSLEEGVTVMEDLAYALVGEKKRDWIVSNAESFVYAITVINEDMQGGNYTITLNGNFAAAPVTFTGGAAKTITLKGEGAARTITNSRDAALFTVPAGVTLVLDSNLVLDGNKKKARLVDVNGGTLTMKAGVTLRNSADSGVVVDGGSFTMSGGTISGNTAADRYLGGGGVFVSSGSFTMSGGTISGNMGSGVFVYDGSFVKRGGGTIDATNRGEGRVVYVDDGKKKRNSAAGPGVNLDSNVKGKAGGWE